MIQLVAIAFIPNPLNLPIVNHKDEDRANNIVENLEWCDSKYNNNYGNHNLNISKSQKGIKHGPLTPEKREQFRLKRNKTMMKKYGRIGPILTEEVRKKHSERMKKKNPMFNIDIKNKMIKTL
ncbi:HNH endonuclease [bacterium]|nr:HNH endonuclease [bacterium]